MFEVGRWLLPLLSRRQLLGSSLAVGGSTVALAQSVHQGHVQAYPSGANATVHAAHGNMITVGRVDDARNGFDPLKLLTDWDTGTLSTLPSGQRLRTFEVRAEDKEIEIAPGIMLPGLDL